MPFPLDLPRLAPGLAVLGPAARAAGGACATTAARSLSSLLGTDVRIAGRAAPGRPAPRGGVGRIAIDLPALPGTALLEVDAALVVALVDRLAGGEGRASAAVALSPIESAALELLALAALDGACEVAEVEAALSPRLGAGPAPEPPGALAIELEVAAGLAAGRARLVLPARALAALAGEHPATGASALRLGASLRCGDAPLTPAELAALSAGDVVLLDASDAAALVLPGGARARGRLVDDTFHAEGTMERNAMLPVTLEVELARVEVTLSDLARLEPGAVLPLGIDRRGRVALVVGERTLARGELVDVEGAVGVRVLEVTP